VGSLAPGLLPVALDLSLGLLGTRNSCHIKDKGPLSERHRVLPSHLVCLGVPSLIFCVNPQKFPLPLVLLFPLLVPAVGSSTPAPSSYSRLSAPCSRTFWKFARRVSAPEPLCHVFFGSVARVFALWPQWLLWYPSALNQRKDASRFIGDFVYGPIYHTISLV